MINLDDCLLSQSIVYFVTLENIIVEKGCRPSGITNDRLYETIQGLTINITVTFESWRLLELREQQRQLEFIYF